LSSFIIILKQQWTIEKQNLVKAAILNGRRSEQKVITPDKDFARKISAKYGSNPSSGS
jgi:hypothetical protein